MQEGVNVGVAYGLWASGGVISTALLSAALFGEPLGAVKLAGIALIIFKERAGEPLFHNVVEVGGVSGTKGANTA